MTELTVDLTLEHVRYLDAEVAAGRAADRNAALTDAVQARMDAAVDSDEIEHWKALRFHELIETAEASLARGEGVVVNDVGAYLDGLMAEAMSRPAPTKKSRFA